MHVKKKTMYVLFVCRTTFPNAGTKCACLDWWFINSRFSSVKPRTFTSLEGGGVLRSTGIWLNLSEKKKGGGGYAGFFFPFVQIVTNSCGIKRKGQTLTNSVIICKKSNNLTHVPSIFYLEQECLCTVQCMKCKPEKIHVTEKYGAYITLLILASVQCQIFSSWSMAPFSEKIL